MSIETTANGIAGTGAVFYHLWKSNYDNPKGQYKTFFFPWFAMDDYESDVKLSELDQDFYGEEKALYVPKLSALGLSERKISWYVQKAKNMKLAGRDGGEIVSVEQEFPSTPEEAFMTTTGTIFDISVIKNLQMLKESLWRHSVHDSMFPDLRFYHLDPKTGKPIPEKNIAIGSDVAEGVSNGDYTTIVGRRRSDLKLLFTYRSHIKPDLLSTVIDRIYKYGYQGLIGIERNNHGHAAIAGCMNYLWQYDLYSQKTIDKRFNRETKRLGWSTTGASKALMISEMERLVRIGELTEFDKREWLEFFTFIYGDDGTMGAISPDHDDCIIADAICIQMAQQKFDKIA